LARAIKPLITDRMTQLVLVRRPEVGERGVRRAIADACGVTQSSVSQWCSGETGNIKNDHLISFALAFDTTLDWLLTGDGDPPHRDQGTARFEEAVDTDLVVVQDTLGDRIAYYRNRSGMSQRALALACGWESQSRVGNYESGTREPTLEDINAMARALGTNAVTLAYGEKAVDEAGRSMAGRLPDRDQYLTLKPLDARVVQRAQVILAFHAILQALDAKGLPPSTLAALEGIAKSVSSTAPLQQT
jgi:transcriptional regulator with XRE-family HTH domain